MTYSQTFRSAAPANTMILGEHSVVYGYPAIAAALDQWITIDWELNDSNRIEIFSELENVSFPVTELYEFQNSKLNFIFSALQNFPADIHCGLTLKVKSEFKSTIGLGSSAAVLAATLQGLNSIFKTQLSIQSLWLLGKRCILQIQGRGSATDLAASLAGGIIFFQPPKDNEKLSKNSDISHPIIRPYALKLHALLIYAGYKTPTAEVLKIVAEHWQQQPDRLTSIYEQMGNITQRADQALADNDTARFFSACQAYQQQMVKLGVNDDTLQTLITEAQKLDSVNAAKISGSGLGDCIIAVGEKTITLPNNSILNHYQQIQVDISPQGAWAKSINTEISQ